MTKADLIEKLHKGSGKSLSKRALEEVIDEVFDHIAKSVKKRAARVGRNPKTGEEIKINASKTVAFKPSPNLKSTL